MDEISRFIKVILTVLNSIPSVLIGLYDQKIDGFHMISTGEEGFFNFAGEEDWAYNGSDGGDFYASTQLPAISYGTYHTVSHDSLLGRTLVDISCPFLVSRLVEQDPSMVRLPGQPDIH